MRLYSLHHLRALAGLTVCLAGGCSSNERASASEPPPMPVQTPAAVSAPAPEPPAHVDVADPNAPRPAPTRPLQRGPAAATDDAGSPPLGELLAQSGRWYWTARNNTKSEQIWLCPDQTARYESSREKLSGRYERTGTKLTLRFGKKKKQATLSPDAKLLTLADKTELGFVKAVDCEPTQ